MTIKVNRLEGVTVVVKHLQLKALSSNLSTAKRKFFIFETKYGRFQSESKNISGKGKYMDKYLIM
jgi:hypothetical protein